VPSHTPSRVCASAWTTQGNFCIYCFLFFFIFSIAGSRSKHFTQTASPSMTTPAKPSLPPSPSFASIDQQGLRPAGLVKQVQLWVSRPGCAARSPKAREANKSLSTSDNPSCQHILAEDADSGRDSLAGVVVEGEVVGVDCFLLEPAIRKINKNRKQWIQKLPWVVHAPNLDSVRQGMLSPTRSTGSVTNLAVSSLAISLALLGNVINLVVPDSVNSLVVPGSPYSMAMGSA
jgi:hypothetical protein